MAQEQLILKEGYRLPESETPARRLAEGSPEYLSDSELLSLLLSGAIGPTKSLQIARELMSAYGSFKRIMNLSLTELQRVPGIGLARACAIQGAVEFARRLHRPDTRNRARLTAPAQVAEFMRGSFANPQQEEFHVLLLDTKHNLLRDHCATVGLVDRSQIHAREVFRPAISECCSRVLLCHNHPSGDPTPSEQDITCTKSLFSAGAVIGIEVLDHVIVGEPNQDGRRWWVSFREESLLPPK
jgi:DNA repair protein RadC